MFQNDLMPGAISGDVSTDDRGVVRFVNDFDFAGIKRFYQVENFDLNTVRAFHGHLKESKYVYVAAGTIILCAVKLDDAENPSKDNKVERFIVSSKKPQVVFIPKGYANGFKALEENTKVMFFSTGTLEESKNDDFRFPYDYWGKEIWLTKNR